MLFYALPGNCQRKKNSIWSMLLIILCLPAQTNSCDARVLLGREVSRSERPCVVPHSALEQRKVVPHSALERRKVVHYEAFVAFISILARIVRMSSGV